MAYINKTGEENIFLTVAIQLINVEEIKEIENQHVVSTIVTIIFNQDHLKI